ANGLGSSDLFTMPSGGGTATLLAGDGYQNSLLSWGAAASYNLHVTTSGNGAVTSAPAGISCGGTCKAIFADPTQVVLTATPASGWTSAGWSGACSGTGTCTLTMLGDRSVTAAFAAASSGGGGGGGGGGSSSLVLSVSPSSQTVTSGSTATWTISVMN